MTTPQPQSQSQSQSQSKRSRLALLVALLLATAPPVAADLFADFSDAVSVDAELAYSSATESDQRHIGSEAVVEVGVEHTLGDRIEWKLSARLRGEQFDRLRPGAVDYASYDGASRPQQLGSHGSVELRDAYFDLRLPNGLVRLGKQQIVWGALDGIKVLDVVNPASFERFILDDFDAARIGLWSALVDVSFGDWRAELALIPDATTHDVPGAGAWFEPTASRYRFGADASAPALPQRHLGAIETEGTIALRLSRYLAGVDLQLVALSGLDFEPLARLVASPSGPVLETYHRRRELLGVSATGSLGPLVLRSEVAFQPDRALPARAGQQLGVQTVDQWRGAVAVDVNAPLGVFVNVQYLVDHLNDAPLGIVRPRTDRLVTVTARRSFRYDTLTADVRLYRSLTDDDALLRAKLRWSLGDQVALSLAAERFRGTPDGIFGQFADRDLVRIGVELQL